MTNMDLENYWQENKRTLTWIGGGLLVFLIANSIVGSTYGDALRGALSDRAVQERDLRESRYDDDALDRAAADNEALIEARDALLSAVVFRPRESFVPDPGQGSISGQYFTRVEMVRDRLSRAASRAGMRPPGDAWGIEMPQTNAAPIYERHLEALDLIDRVVNHALDVGVERIERIQVRLDPAFGSKQGLGRLERTKVELDFRTSAASMTRLLTRTQTPDEHDQSLTLEELEVEAERNRPGDVRASVTFTIVRIHETSEDEA